MFYLEKHIIITTDFFLTLNFDYVTNTDCVGQTTFRLFEM